MRLFIDTETSDRLPKRTERGREIPWPVSIAAALCDDDDRMLDFMHVRIRSDGRTIAPGAEAIHGISTRAAARSGVVEHAALGVLCGLAAQARYLVGFNVAFDRLIIESEMRQMVRTSGDWIMWAAKLQGSTPIAVARACVEAAKAKLETDLRIWCRTGLATVDLMEPATPMCKIPSGHESGSYKWPTLDEACQILLGEKPRGQQHNAWDDLQRTIRLHRFLADRGVIEREAA